MGNVVYAGAQGLVLLVLAKLGSPELVGIYALGLAVTGPVFMLTSLALRPVAATDVEANFTDSEYFLLRTAGMTAGLVGAGMLAWAFGYSLFVLAVVCAVGVTKAIEGFSDLCYGFFQRSERLDRLALSRLFRGLLSALAMLVGLSLTGSLLISVLLIAAGWFLVLISFDVPHYRRMGRVDAGDRGVRSIRRLAALGVTSVPLALAMMLISLNASIPRYWIEDALDASALGFFAAAAYLVFSGTTIVSAIGQAALVPLRRMFLTESRRYTALLAKLIVTVLGLGLFGTFLAAIAGREILSLLYTSDYGAYADLLVLLSVAGTVGFAGSIINRAITATRHLVHMLPLYVTTTATVLVLSMVLIPRFGLAGAALAVLGGNLVEVIAGGAVIGLAVKEKVNIASPLPNAGVGSTGGS